jgi:hypothetical protein
MNESNANGSTMKAVFTVVERSPGKSHWTRVGVGFVNRDGSMNLKLDAIPVNGTLQVREWEPAERFNGAGPREAGDAQARGPRREARPQPPPASPASPDGALF